MRNLFNVDSPLMQALYRASMVLWLGLLWLLCSLPVVTLGAASTALYQMFFHLQEDKECTTAAFFHAMKGSFRTSTLLNLMVLAAAGLMVLFGFVVLQMQSAPLQMVVLLLGLVVFYLLAVTVVYLFPLTAYFENTVGNDLRNALLMALTHPARTLEALALALSPFFFLFLLPNVFLVTTPVWLLVMPGALQYWISKLLRPVFRTYVSEPEAEELTEEEAQ